MRRTSLIALMILGLASAVNAKDVSQTSVPQACKGASYVVIAVAQRHEYEALEEGKPKTLYIFSLWSEFKVSETLKAPKGAAALDGKTLRLVNKSNSCINWKTTATRKGERVELEHDHGKGVIKREIISLASLRKMRQKKVILFVQAGKGPGGKPSYSHFGWFVSPSAWSKKLEAQVRGLLASKKK